MENIMPRGRQVNMPMIIAIGNELPADGYPDLAYKVTTTTGNSVSAKEIAGYISWIRKNRLLLGWWIPHCKRGPTMPGSKRLIMQLVDEENNTSFDDADLNDEDRRDELYAGMLGTIQQAAAQLEVTKLTLDIWRAKPYVSPARKRVMRSMGVKTSHFAEELRMLQEDLLEEAAA